MAQTSLRENLSKIGEPSPGTATIHIPSGFHTAPKSLRAMMHSMNSPKMESWAVKCEDHQAHGWWTYDCQGIATDGEYLYAVNANNNEDPWIGIFKFTHDYGDAKRSTQSPAGTAHIGPPNYFDGKIYVPVEGDTARVWILDTELNTLGFEVLGGTERPPQGNSMPWCAINPWNGFLYSSKFGNGPIYENRVGPGGLDELVQVGDDRVTEVHCYDPKNHFVFAGSFQLKGEGLYKANGGCFSTNGHLYLTSDVSHDIKGYNALNGSYLGSFHVPSDWSGGEEMEGLSIGNSWCKNTGDYTPVNVLVLDNDWPHKDSDIWLKYIAVPEPEFL